MLDVLQKNYDLVFDLAESECTVLPYTGVIPHCDMCAGDFGSIELPAVVHGENVVCCSLACLERLYDVWQPTVKKMEMWPIVARAIGIISILTMLVVL